MPLHLLLPGLRADGGITRDVGIIREIGKSFESAINTRARRRMPSAIEGRVFKLISMRALPNEIKQPARVPS